MIKKYLMTPGPTQIPPQVLLAGAQPIIHHRTKAYSEIFAAVLEDLKYVFQTSNDILCFASSGTGGMESAVVNLLSPGDPVLIASCGKFGERWRDLAEVYGLDFDYLEYEWGTPVAPEDIGKAVSEKEYQAVFVTHSETSTGVVNDMQAIGQAVADSQAVLVADSISGMGSAELKTDEWQVDVAVAGSQKALMCPPGLAFVSVSEKAWAMTDGSNAAQVLFRLGQGPQGAAGGRSDYGLYAARIPDHQPGRGAQAHSRGRPRGALLPPPAAGQGLPGVGQGPGPGTVLSRR